MVAKPNNETFFFKYADNTKLIVPEHVYVSVEKVLLFCTISVVR